MFIAPTELRERAQALFLRAGWSDGRSIQNGKKEIYNFLYGLCGVSFQVVSTKGGQKHRDMCSEFNSMKKLVKRFSMKESRVSPLNMYNSNAYGQVHAW